MQLTFIPTKLAGGVVIKGDNPTIRKIERLLARTAIESYACDDNGMCMTLSRYFEKKNDTVDWITLITGIAALRHSIGYRLSREDHALMCILEHSVFEALCKTLTEKAENVEAVLDSLYGFNDQLHGKYVESRMTYLYLLKEPETRKEELLKILQSMSPTLKHMVRDYSEQFKELNSDMLTYAAGQKFEYEL